MPAIATTLRLLVLTNACADALVINGIAQRTRPIRMYGEPEVAPRLGYSKADQVARFNAAKEAGNARYLDIATVFDGNFLKGKRVLITGGNQGLGLAIVKELVTQEAEVVVVGRRSSPELDELNVQVITGIDVTDIASVSGKMVDEIGGPLDYVINNAGCALLPPPRPTRIFTKIATPTRLAWSRRVRGRLLGGGGDD